MNDGSSGGDTSTDGGQNLSDAQALPFTCAPTFSPNPCPAPSGAAGEADFCFRPQWAGATQVQVYFGPPTTSFNSYTMVSLSADGSGTWTGKATSVATGTYSYLFHVMGSTDNVIDRNGEWLLDQEAAQFTSGPPNAPIGRSFPVMSIPQPTTLPTFHHVTGTVVYGGAPQSCYQLSLDVGEILGDGGAGVISEHGTANYMETDSTGKFDFAVTDGQVGIGIRYPFLLSGLDAGYPNGLSTPSVGIARTTVEVSGADLPLDPADVSYPESAYAAMSPTNGATQTLPVTFTFSLVPGSVETYVSVTSTNTAGDDPAYASTPGTATSVMWDGTFGKDASAAVNTTYWWGAWQHRQLSDAGTMWVDESMLFPLPLQ